MREFQALAVAQLYLITDIAVMEFDGEPRIRDLDLADRLGFERPRDIRELIERNLDELGRPRRRDAYVETKMPTGEDSEKEN